MDLKAKYPSYGFRKKYWETGEIVENVTAEELKMSEMKHFEKIGNVITEIKSDPVPITLKEVAKQEEYQTMTNNQLKALLDEKGIKYPPNANKQKLVEYLCGIYEPYGGGA
jgi:hypothetical protein